MGLQRQPPSLPQAAAFHHFITDYDDKDPAGEANATGAVGPGKPSARAVTSKPSFRPCGPTKAVREQIVNHGVVE